MSPLLWAQNNDNYEVPPMTFGGFNNQGSAEVGYRFTEVKGFQPMYKELFDLESGPRLLDFNLFGEAREGAQSICRQLLALPQRSRRRPVSHRAIQCQQE